MSDDEQKPFEWDSKIYDEAWYAAYGRIAFTRDQVATPLQRWIHRWHREATIVGVLLVAWSHAGMAARIKRLEQDRG